MDLKFVLEVNESLKNRLTKLQGSNTSAAGPCKHTNTHTYKCTWGHTQTLIHSLTQTHIRLVEPQALKPQTAGT